MEETYIRNVQAKKKASNNHIQILKSRDLLRHLERVSNSIELAFEYLKSNYDTRCVIYKDSRSYIFGCVHWIELPLDLAQNNTLILIFFLLIFQLFSFMI